MKGSLDFFDDTVEFITMRSTGGTPIFNLLVRKIPSGIGINAYRVSVVKRTLELLLQGHD